MDEVAGGRLTGTATPSTSRVSKETRTWEFFIALDRDLPTSRDEPSSSDTEPIPSNVDVRQQLFDQQNVGGRVICPGCQRAFDQLYLDLMDVDHIRPKKRTGTHTWDNVQLLCRTCNSGKRESTLTQFLQMKTAKEWVDAVRSSAEPQKNEDLDGEWAYFVKIMFHLNKLESDPDGYPAFRVIDLSKLILDALQGVIWKRRSQVVSISTSKSFSKEGNQQGVQIRVKRVLNRA